MMYQAVPEVLPAPLFYLSGTPIGRIRFLFILLFGFFIGRSYKKVKFLTFSCRIT
jgi:hypothetical protein